jgi:hypothetical protein
MSNFAKALTAILICSFFFSSNLAVRAETYSVPSEACELSKKYPTVVFKIDPKYALTSGLLLIDCYVDIAFPTITANPDYYTAIGQFTVDYANMKRVAFLTWRTADYENLRTPNWMPYMLDTSTGDYGDQIYRNMFGLHAAPWRYTAEFYGKQDILNGGSHGCTNLRIGTSEYLYNFMLENQARGQKVKVFNYL